MNPFSLFLSTSRIVVPIPFSVFPSSYRTDATASTDIRLEGDLELPSRASRVGREDRFTAVSASANLSGTRHHKDRRGRHEDFEERVTVYEEEEDRPSSRRPRHREDHQTTIVDETHTLHTERGGRKHGHDHHGVIDVEVTRDHSIPSREQAPVTAREMGEHARSNWLTLDEHQVITTIADRIGITITTRKRISRSTETIRIDTITPRPTSRSIVTREPITPKPRSTSPSASIVTEFSEHQRKSLSTTSFPSIIITIIVQAPPFTSKTQP
ncbi:MAG: Transcription factor spt8 [Watsoniomyces obsoletus]|nr:MAG: Transcription factor spt8 [Watsoniomyces obsoletus]